MSARKRRASGAIIFGMIVIEAATVSSQARAASALPNDADILGLRLTMSSAQIKQYLTEKLGAATVFDVPATIATNQFKESGVFGFVAEITGDREQQENERKLQQLRSEAEAKSAAGLGNSPIIARQGDFGYDKIRVAFLPKEDGVTAVVRKRAYPKDEQPIVATVISAFEAKYGTPELTTGPLYYWASKGGLSKDRSHWAGCVNAIEGGNYTGSISPQEDYRHWTDDNIQGLRVQYLVNYAAQNKNLLSCGVILKVRLATANDGQHVAELDETLVDLSKGQTAAEAFAADFWKNADKAKQGQISKDAQRKPQL